MSRKFVFFTAVVLLGLLSLFGVPIMSAQAKMPGQNLSSGWPNLVCGQWRVEQGQIKFVPIAGLYTRYHSQDEDPKVETVVVSSGDWHVWNYIQEPVIGQWNLFSLAERYAILYNAWLDEDGPDELIAFAGMALTDNCVNRPLSPRHIPLRHIPFEICGSVVNSPLFPIGVGTGGGTSFGALFIPFGKESDPSSWFQFASFVDISSKPESKWPFTYPGTTQNVVLIGASGYFGEDGVDFTQDYKLVSSCRSDLTSPKRLPDVEHRVLRGDEWLDGKGVDVFYKNRSGCDSSCAVLEPYNTCAFQCVDLAVRLYGQVGYPNWSFDGGRSLISSAVQMADVARQRPVDFKDLEFYPNDGTATRPPAPGNLLIFAAADSNGHHGHVAVVNRVAGDRLQFIQQNLCDGKDKTPRPSGQATIEVTLRQGSQAFRIRPELSYASLIGWIHSERVKQGLIDQPRIEALGGLSWNRDDTTLYLYLSPASVRLLAFGEPAVATRKTPAKMIADLLPAHATALTDGKYVEDVLKTAANWIRSDSRLHPNKGVRSVDIALKYTGRMHWLRPWGGPANGKWVPFTMDKLSTAADFQTTK